MKIKFWAWVYRTTGYYHKPIAILFWQQVDWWEIQSKLLNQKEDIYKLTLANILSIEEGSWQAKHGFYRTMKQLKRRRK
jgi:hypothetical protein